MTHKQQPAVIKSTDDFFRLNPLTASVRVIIASGMLAGSGVSAVSADSLSPLPVPTNIVPLPAEVTNPQVDIPNLTTIPHQIIPVADQALHGQATAVLGDHKLTVNQITDKAIIDWKSFNVDKGYTVNFVQPSVSAIALNNIYQADASQIMGSITANGQVYLYNQNGFVFGKDSVVNTNSLLASTLQITDEVFSRGMTRVFDENGSAALVIEPKKDGASLDPKTAKILIEAGAKIHTDKSGRIIIVAPKIENKGSLSSEAQGQIIMAASQDKVYLQAADASSPFAGLLVEVDTGGSVSNVGDVLAKQGNITMAGFAVNQQGRLTATTSVNVNGSIRLLAQEQHGLKGTGLIATKTSRATDLNDGLGTESKATFAQGSVTQIIADKQGGSAIDEQAQAESYLEVSANTVHLQSGSLIKSPAGQVNITATDSLLDPIEGTKGRIYIDKSAQIDVSGIKGVTVPMERNVGEISVQSFELRDAPYQRTGVLKGENIKVDLRKDTAIVDVSGAKARVSRSIEERLSGGGEINLTASGDVIIHDGADFNISGGSVAYQDGFINTTKLINDNGQVVDISAADPNQHFKAIFGTFTETHTKWGAKTLWNLLPQKGQFERGYTEGKNAGDLNVKAPLLAWNGELTAGSDAGVYQRDLSVRPYGGSVGIDLGIYDSLQNVRLQTEGLPIQIALTDAFNKVDSNQSNALTISTKNISKSRLQDITIKTSGDVSLVENAILLGVAGGELTLNAANINIDGDVKLPGGVINLKATSNTVAQNAGVLRVGQNASLDVAGLWVNDFNALPTQLFTDPVAINAGAVKLQAELELSLSQDSTINADGGARVQPNGRLQAGNAGDINLAAIGLNGQTAIIKTEGILSAYGLEKNGSLSLNTGKIVVEKSADILSNVVSDSSLILGVTHNSFDLLPQLAFNTINLNANFDSLTIKSGTEVELKAQNLALDTSFLSKPTGSSLRDFSQVVELTEDLRQPIQLSLSGLTGVNLEANSTIILDKESTLNLLSKIGSLYVDGSIQSEAGNINLNIKPLAGLEYDAKQSIWLGEHAQLITQGTSRLSPVDNLGYRSGQVLSGGQININAERGAVVVADGSLLDVSGTSAAVDILHATANGVINHRVETIASDAGQININAADGIVLEGKLIANAESSTVHGGKLQLSLDRFKVNPPDQPNIPFPSNPLVFNVVQTLKDKLSQSFNFGSTLPDTLIGEATVYADNLMQNGFTSLNLTTKDEVSFVGDVNLNMPENINIDAKIISAKGEGALEAGSINVTTNSLKMGSSLNRIVPNNVDTGSGEFSAHAQWTELSGVTQWNGFKNIVLNSAHDIRTTGIRNTDEQRDYVGGLITSADLSFAASQIYPSTLSDFTFAIKNNPDSKINITGSNTDQSPLSAGGSLTFLASEINQMGVVKAPLGSINFKADKVLNIAEHSLTSVSANGLAIPFGVVQGGLDWLYPLDNIRNLVNNELEQRMEKHLVFSAPEINLAKDSVVNVTGGGDLSAYEFQPGAGGSYDYLRAGSASNLGGFAIIPSLGANLAPYDHYESNGFNYATGSSIHLKASSGLPEGDYTMLPAHYALLPGAFLITPQANTQDINLNQYTADGRAIVPGYQTIAGTSLIEQRSNGYLIENSIDVATHSKYDIYTANQFYENKSIKNETVKPLVPIDGGQISLIAENKLVMDGQFMVDALTGGRGVTMDIAANQINIVKDRSLVPTVGVLEILDKDLSKLKVDSLLVGGARSRNLINRAHTDLAVSADNVIISSGATLLGPEIIAVAKDKIEVQSGASITADQPATSGASWFNIKGDGALLRVSGDKQITLNRTNAAGIKGELSIAEGVTLTATGSMLLDATKSTILLGDILMNKGSLNLSANNINIGEVASLGGQDLNLTNEKLQSLTVDELVLNSRGNINFYGNVNQVDDIQKAITFKDLTINAAGITGFGRVGDIARIAAQNIKLSNTTNVVSSQIGLGAGLLELTATKNLIQGSGNFAMSGFNSTANSSAASISIANAFVAEGKGALNLANDLILTAGVIATTGGANLTVDATDHALYINQSPIHTKLTTPGFGGAINFVADSMAFDGHALMPSGNLTLHALNGEVSLGANAQIDLAGRAIKFADKIEYTAGGRFSTVSDQGLITTALGSSIDVSSGGGNATGGLLLLKAPTQTLDLKGDIKATKGSATIDVATFADGANFDALMAVLNTAQVSDSIYFRARNADVIQSSTINLNANDITLVSDNGSVDINGQLHANSSEQAGIISVYAGDKITLQDNAVLSAIGKQGGKILLSSTDNDNDLNSGIVVKDKAIIDVTGIEKAGSVTLRALRTTDSINVDPIANAVVKGVGSFNAEAVKKYTNADLGNDHQINEIDINAIKAETESFMSAATLQNVAGLTSGLKLVAGVEIDHVGDLSLQDKWDLMAWRYDDIADSDIWDDAAGRLVIKTTGAFAIEKSLTDGFKTTAFSYPGAIEGQTNSINIVDKLQGGDSWSYNLIAGSDLTSADLNSTKDLSNITIASNTLIRTGNGDMSLIAGGDVVFTDNTSTIYNAGQPTQSLPYGSLKDRFVGQSFYVEYPVEGGDLTLKAGGNIVGAATKANDFNDWLLRIGNWTNSLDHAGQRPTAWGVALGYLPIITPNVAKSTKPFFNQNVASFGGGIVNVSAAGNINNLDVVMPTTGKQVGIADNSTAGSFNFITNKVEVNGGGTMHINAGGDIAGGTYYLGKGVGTMTAGGQVTGGNFANGPEFLLGDTQFSINAGSGASINGVSDPMISHKADVNFYSYTPESAINVSTLAGDILLSSNGGVFPRSNTNSNQQTLASVYPASLHASAISGSIKVLNEMLLFPGAKAELSLLADQNIVSDVNIRLGMSDGDIALLPKLELPTSRNKMSEVIGRISPFSGDPKLFHATIPLHTGDNEPARVVTLQGNIENIGLNVAKKAIVKSGNDMTNVSLAIQHVNDGDATLIEANRDIKYTSDRDPASGSLLGNSAKIEVGGSGEVLVKAGRNIDLGASGGISTLGNILNTSLADLGANLTILPGASSEINYQGFIATYLVNNEKYSIAYNKLKPLITGFMRAYLNDAGITDEDALNKFSELNNSDFEAIQPQINAIVLPVLFNEIRESGTASAGTKGLANAGGYAAIETLFSPESQWKGDLSLFFSKINTVDSGNINLIVPGGLVNAGLAVSFTGAKPASELGIVAQRQGAINAMVRDDFKVNTSRIFSLDGSDIQIWSSEGDIDAGRGAKSAIAAPPPKISFDKNGNMVIEFPPIVSGSGIRTASSTEGKLPGDVYLFAPKGIVDAGEAGIGGNNVTISATAVLGANNISVGGVGTGVPQASSGSIAAGLTGTSNMTASVSQAGETAAKEDEEKKKKTNSVLGMLSVDLLGFGE